jgi:exopolysaccharide production protein ExoQ
MNHKTSFVVRHIKFILIAILFVKIAGYFSIVEERSVNQVFKTISRVGMTGAILFVLSRLKKKGCIPAFKYDNLLSPILYSAYLLLAVASFGWSTDPQYSILQWSMTFESFVFTFAYIRVLVIINKHFPDHKIDLISLFAWAVFPFMIIFIIGSFADPDTFYRGMRGGEEKRLGGWIMNPNELGMLSSMGAAMAYLLIQKTKSKTFPLLMIASAIVVLALTSSRSSAIGFLLIMGILVLLSKNKKVKIIMIAGVSIAGPIMINYIVFKDSGGIEEVMSMTGRLPFWKALLNEGIVREPWFGFGFMRINYTDYFQGLGTYPAKMTHNTFMQVLMNLGFVGFFIAFWQLIQTLRNFFKEKNSPHKNFFNAMFIPIIINSFTEFGIFGEANYTILFYQFLIWIFVIDFKTKFSPREKIAFNLFKRQNRLSQIGNSSPEKSN